MRTQSFALALASLIATSPVYAIDSCQSIFDTPSRYETREVMDVSRTEKAKTFSAQPKNKHEIQNAIVYAKQHGLKVTIKGTNHSHGGHNRRQQDVAGKPRAIQLDMLGYNRILKLDKENKEVTVEAGVTWKELSVFLDQYGLAAMTEQSSNIFSIGGSVSTNVHGRDVHGPLINSIKEIKFLNSDGVEQRVNRSEHPEVFKALVGGYGGLGVITEVTLFVEKNYLYQAHSVTDISVKDYAQYLRALDSRPSNLMHYGRINLSGKTGFTKVSYTEWTPVNEGMVAKEWAGWKLNLGEKNIGISSAIMNLMRYRPTSEVGKYVKDVADKFFGLPKTGTVKTKNNILNNPVQFLFDNFYNQKSSVDILQEYFVPVDRMEPFLATLKAVTEKHDLDLMNVTFRYVPKVKKGTNSILSPYSEKEDLVAIVLYYNVEEARGKANGLQVDYNGSQWTQELIQRAQDLGGSFYWPYHRWWTPEQIKHQSEGEITEYFHIKEKVDPQNLFESDFIYYLREASQTK